LLKKRKLNSFKRDFVFFSQKDIPLTFKSIEESAKVYEGEKLNSSKEFDTYHSELEKVIQEERESTALLQDTLKAAKESTSSLDAKIREVDNEAAMENLKITKHQIELNKKTNLLTSQIECILSKSKELNRN
jgi:hypothetical protein